MKITFECYFVHKLLLRIPVFNWHGAPPGNHFRPLCPLPQPWVDPPSYKHASVTVTAVCVPPSTGGPAVPWGGAVPIPPSPGPSASLGTRRACLSQLCCYTRDHRPSSLIKTLIPCGSGGWSLRSRRQRGGFLVRALLQVCGQPRARCVLTWCRDHLSCLFQQGH